MLPNGKGRHCSSCEKTVIDFSKLSDSEIYKILDENNSKVCGRFSAFQLNRSIYSQVQINKSIYPKVLLGAALATCAVFPSFSQDSFAEIQTEISSTSDKVHSNKLGPEFGKDSSKYIRGFVISSKTLKPISYAEVNLNGLGKPIVTNDCGYFEYKLIEDYPYPDSIEIKVSVDGYFKQKKQISINSIPKIIEFKMEEEYFFYGEIEVIKED